MPSDFSSVDLVRPAPVEVSRYRILMRIDPPPDWHSVSTIIHDGMITVARALRLPPCEISLWLTDDSEITELNRHYRGRDVPTNSLSFPSGQQVLPPDMPHILGDIVLAYTTITIEARAQAKSFNAHASHLALHGLLHLLGHTHDNSNDATQMEAQEIALLKLLNIADPYATKTMHTDSVK